jgi:hypothetical protein
MLDTTIENRLKEIVFFLYQGLELLDKETKHELILHAGYDAFFGSGYMTIKFSIPKLDDLFFTDKYDALKKLMGIYSIEHLDNIYIRFKIREPKDLNDSEEKIRLASEQTEEIVSIVKKIFELENVFLTIDKEPKK